MHQDYQIRGKNGLIPCKIFDHETKGVKTSSFFTHGFVPEFALKIHKFAAWPPRQKQQRKQLNFVNMRTMGMTGLCTWGAQMISANSTARFQLDIIWNSRLTRCHFKTSISGSKEAIYIYIYVTIFLNIMHRIQKGELAKLKTNKTNTRHLYTNMHTYTHKRTYHVMVLNLSQQLTFKEVLG